MGVLASVTYNSHMSVKSIAENDVSTDLFHGILTHCKYKPL